MQLINSLTISDHVIALYFFRGCPSFHSADLVNTALTLSSACSNYGTFKAKMGDIFQAQQNLSKSTVESCLKIGLPNDEFPNANIYGNVNKGFPRHE